MFLLLMGDDFLIKENFLAILVLECEKLDKIDEIEFYWTVN